MIQAMCYAHGRYRFDPLSIDKTYLTIKNKLQWKRK